MKKRLLRLVYLFLVCAALLGISGVKAEAKTTSYPMFKNKYLVHALGPYKGKYYQNTEKAFEASKKLGYKYFEVDLKMTSDGKLVCSHGWDKDTCKAVGMTYKSSYSKKMTRSQFLKLKANGQKTLDGLMLYDLIKKNTKYYFELDLHTLDKNATVRVVKELLREFHYDSSVLNRCLVQANSIEMYEAIESVYHFKYYQMNVKYETSLYNTEFAYCKEHGIGAVAIPYKEASKAVIQRAKKCGLKVLVYTLNSIKDCQKYLDRGADTICTNEALMTVKKSKLKSTVASSTYSAKESVTKNTLFIGDSRCYGMYTNYSGLSTKVRGGDTVYWLAESNTTVNMLTVKGSTVTASLGSKSTTGHVVNTMDGKVSGTVDVTALVKKYKIKNIVYCLGLVNVKNTDHIQVTCDTLKALKQYTGCKVYFATTLPVDETILAKRGKDTKNAAITAYNDGVVKALSADSSGITVIDTYDMLVSSDVYDQDTKSYKSYKSFTTDGLNYLQPANQAVYDYIMEAVMTK